MTLEDLTTLIDNSKLDTLKSSLEVSKYAYLISDSFGITGQLASNSNIEITALKQYNPKWHDVLDEGKRKDKIISGVDENGNPSQREGLTVKVARLPLPEQKKIVLLASAFLGTPSLSSTPKPGTETDMLSVIESISEDNKLDYKFKNIAKKTMSERECAEIWFTEPAEKDYWDGTPMEGILLKLRMRILSPSLGDTLYPVYDNYGDMVAFGRYYEMVVQDFATNTIGQKEIHFDVYTKDRFYFTYKDQGGHWVFNNDQSVTLEDGTKTGAKGIPNMIGKIPVVYYFQPYTEWHDVQEMIDRLETKISNHADTNDYFDSPIVFAEGEITGFAEKGERGKVLEGKNGAKVSYLTWDNAPESTRMEVDNLIKFINTYTHTPNISFDNIKGLGTFTGIALKMFFMDAHLKASDKEEIFGESVQRRINYLKHAIAVLSPKFKSAVRLVIKPEFDYFLPKNETEELQNIIAAVGAGIMSIETAIKLNPLIEDYEAEIELIKKEAEEKAGKAIPTAADPNNPKPIAEPNLKVA